MNWWQTIILGIVEGLSEFLPISSTAHLTITEKLMGMNIADGDVTAYTAIIQVGAILASVIYFWRDIVRLAVGWFKGLFDKTKRGADYRLGWAVILGSLPVGVIGFALRKVISGPFRNLWVVAAALIGWSIVMILADRMGKRERQEKDVTWRDTLIIGTIQALGLIPGVSRSGATISTGLFRNLDRVTATRISFFLGIPALVAAGAYEAASEASKISAGVGWMPTIIGIVISFIVGYASIAWLLKFVAKNSFTAFVVYRVLAAMILIGLLAFKIISAT